MHFDFHFTTVTVLWTLTFAAQLVLLVVLLGRDRIHRFPWFTTSIVLAVLGRLTNRILHDKLPQLTMAKVALTIADLSAIVGLILLVEIARRAFLKAGRTAWIAWTVGLLALGGIVLWKWGVWPKTLAFDTTIAKLQFMQMAAVKAGLLMDVLSVALGVLVVLFGARYGAGWRSHTQRIMIGISTASLSQIAVQAIWQVIVRHTTVDSRATYEHLMNIQERLVNSTSMLYLLVTIWWIACLWIDEPGSTASASVKIAEIEAPAASEAGEA